MEFGCSFSCSPCLFGLGLGFIYLVLYGCAALLVALAWEYYD
jgi:hypothetical protein